MSNMSYCRFRNTLADLGECYNYMDRKPEELSVEEARAREALINVCKDIAEEYGEE